MIVRLARTLDPFTFAEKYPMGAEATQGPPS